MSSRNPSLNVKRVADLTVNINTSAHLPRGSKTIIIPFQKEDYPEIVQDRIRFRDYINKQYEKYPELFPEAMKNGYQLNGFAQPSKKLGLIQRRIVIKDTNINYSIAPSFVMPYMTGYTEESQKGLLLIKYGVPFWVVAWVLGRDAMYWWRISLSLGRNSIVGTTIKNQTLLPKDIVVDEKVTWLDGREINIATTASKECILGAAICTDRSTEGLAEAYAVFKGEAQNINSDYAPVSVNTDGSTALQSAFKLLFPNIVIILCYLHSVLDIKSCTKRLGEVFHEIMERIWHIYRASTKQIFSQRMRRFKEWAVQNIKSPVVLSKVIKFCGKSKMFQMFYDYPTAYRTSNMIDRLMDRQDRFLYIMKYFHGHFISAELGIRSWVILMNFSPYCPRATNKKGDWVCAAQKLNGFRYHNNWLENFLISSSMNGYRQ